MTATATDTPQVFYECLAPICRSGPSSGFRIEATAGASFTAAVGSTVPFGTGSLAGSCIVESATVVRCAPAAEVEVPVGATVLMPRMAVALPVDAAPGTTVLRTGLVAADADSANDQASYVLHTADMLSDRLIFGEGFENGQGTGSTLLTDYTGPNPLGQTYTASPAWLTNCNGTIQSYGLTAATLPTCSNASATADLKKLSWALGVFGADVNGGLDPAVNHALGSFTSANVAGGQTLVLAGVSSFAVTPGHYYTTSFDVAARSCEVRGASYFAAFVLPDQSTYPLNGSAINPCQLYQTTVIDPQGGANALGRYFADNAYQATGSALSFQITNSETTGSGNDSAIDNLAVYDVTPAMSKSFSPATGLVAGQSSRLTFSISNSQEYGEKDGWTISDQLPAGLTVANDPAVASTCAASTVTAPSGANTVSAVASLAAGSVGCEISLSVVSSTAGTFANCAENLAAGRGLILPSACAEVSYSAAPSTSEPSSTDPSTSEPGSTEPSTSKPSPTDPSATEPSPSTPSTSTVGSQPTEPDMDGSDTTGPAASGTQPTSIAPAAAGAPGDSGAGAASGTSAASGSADPTTPPVSADLAATGPAGIPGLLLSTVILMVLGSALIVVSRRRRTATRD